MTGLPVNPSSTMWLSNSALPHARKYPGISHSTSSVRHERILDRSVCRNPSMYRSTVRLLSDMRLGWDRSQSVDSRYMKGYHMITIWTLHLYSRHCERRPDSASET